MAIIFKVEPTELIEKTAQELKKIKEIAPPEWASYVKTGMSKERPPVSDDWWYVRAASVLRAVYIKGPIGVQKLRTKYGSKKNRGVKKERFYKGSGNILRKILQQLEKAGLLSFKKDGVHRGRIITAKGQSFVDKIALSLDKIKEKPKADKKEASEKKGNKPKTEKKEAPEKKEEKPENKEVAEEKTAAEKKEEKSDKKEAAEKKEEEPKADQDNKKDGNAGGDKKEEAQ